MVIHIVTIDLRQVGISFMITPGDPKEALPLAARTTTQFLEEYKLQLAVNGDGFSPWRANGPFDYYPRNGDPVKPLGLAASNGQIYAQAVPEQPVMYISRNKQVRLNNPPKKIYNAISGNLMLVDKGDIASDLISISFARAGAYQPRTAVGVDKRGKYLFIVVIDGCQPGYSDGVNLVEIAEILVELGAHFAMNLDGGGSSTLVTMTQNGSTQTLNSPIHGRNPGRQRPVGNHLGIYAWPE
jgi:exopolysaccharide biosynthesis protein